MFLSFVVPVYNAAQYLPECLDSLLAQDISTRSAARLRQKLPDIPVISLPCTMQTLSRYTGKNTGILAVCDENFAGGIRAMMSDDEEDLDR